MTSTPDPERAPPSVLVSVHDVREEIRAGLGNAQVAVRTLDGVSLSVHAGEFIVVRGGIASGATSLLAALAGQRTYASGIRRAAPTVQIRRGAIAAPAFRAMRQAWVDHTPQARPSDIRSVALYLFRVRRAHADEADVVSVDVSRWQAWARALRESGSSVLVHLPHDVDEPRIGSSTSPEKHTPAVFENTTGENSSYRRSGVRELTIAAGRLVSAVPATRPMSFRGSDGYAPQSACDPAPTTWPAP